ncbi:MAG: HEAT repeat domain-containing protein [Verrucomicrobia bacterium]|nr:HEAT repeat domain-containing protein [Verrucomicrobiota bacterium]
MSKSTLERPSKLLRHVLLGGVLWLGSGLAWWKWTEQDQFEEAFVGQVWALQQGGPAAVVLSESKRAVLWGKLSSPLPAERWEAARELARWRDKISVPALRRALRDDDGTIRTCQIAIALGRIGDPSAIPALAQAIEHPSNLDLRICAAHALGEIGDSSVAPILVRRANDASLREDDQGSAILALGEIGAADALPILHAIAEDAQRWTAIRDLARSAIQQTEIVQADNPIPLLLEQIRRHRGWIADEWTYRKLHEYWNAEAAHGLNAILREHPEPNQGLLIRCGALLTHHRAWEPEILQALDAPSAPKAARWLAAAVHFHRLHDGWLVAGQP